MAEHNSWKREKNLENAKEVVTEFERRLNVEVRKKEMLDMLEKRDFRREELLGKYIAKMLHGWNNKEFEEKYLRKLERNW